MNLKPVKVVRCVEFIKKATGSLIDQIARFCNFAYYTGKLFYIKVLQSSFTFLFIEITNKTSFIIFFLPINPSDQELFEHKFE